MLITAVGQSCENISDILNDWNVCWTSSPELIAQPEVTEDVRLLSYWVLGLFV